MAAAISAIFDTFGGVPSVTTLFVFVFTFLLVFYTTRRRPGLPPGPPLIPIIGNLLSLASTDILAVLRRLRRTYGDIYGLYVGSECIVVLNGYDVIHGALIKNGSVFGKRPTSATYNMVIQRPGIVTANGDLWKEHRQFTQKVFNKICFMEKGQNLDLLISTEATCLVSKLQSIDGPFVIDDYLKMSAGNVICMILMNHRFDFEDELYLNILSTFEKSADLFARQQVLANCFPYLQKMPGDLLSLKYSQKLYFMVIDVLKPFMDKCKDSNSERTAKGLVGLYCERLRNNAESNTSDTFTDLRMRGMSHDLMAAGVETTATTLRWLILYLIRDPRIQEKIYAEIKQELGTTPPTLRSRKALLYTEAVILEGLRISHAVPLAVPHGVTRDTMFRNYLIPDKSTVIVNLESVLKDPNVWKNPDEFRPERFLNDMETELVIPPEFIPFSIGHRSCVGETLARMELFIFLTSLVQAFQFRSASEDNSLPDTSGQLGLTHSPKSFPIRIVKRELV